MDNFTITLLTLSSKLENESVDQKRFIPSTENVEGAVKVYFENHIRYTEGSEKCDLTQYKVFDDFPSSTSELKGWFIVREDNEHQLYRIVDEKQKGWISSTTVTKPKLQMSVKFETVHMHGSPYIYGESLEVDTEAEIITTIKSLLDQIEQVVTGGREERIALAKQLFEYLCTPKGKRFVHHYYTFKETVRNKLMKLIFIEKWYEANTYYHYLFGFDISKFVTRNY